MPFTLLKNISHSWNDFIPTQSRITQIAGAGFVSLPERLPSKLTIAEDGKLDLLCGWKKHNTPPFSSLNIKLHT